MKAASCYGIILSDVMNRVGIDLDLRRVRALEYEVWTNMDKDDFIESIYCRFILPRKERKTPVFCSLDIFEIPEVEYKNLKEDLEHFVSSLIEKSEGTEELMFSDIAVRNLSTPPQPKVSMQEKLKKTS